MLEGKKIGVVGGGKMGGGIMAQGRPRRNRLGFGDPCRRKLPLKNLAR